MMATNLFPDIAMSECRAVKIQGQVQAYQWGGKTFIPELLGVPNTKDQPQAEYWLGAHPSARAATITNATPVDELLATNGAPPLRFLLKILDVQDMLSIQAHPNKQQAQDGFARENARGIPQDAKHRNYKDASDKPELMVALSEFWLLHGFRDENEIAALLAKHECLSPLQNRLCEKGLTDAFAFALDFADAGVLSMQHGLAQNLLTASEPFPKATPEFWIQRWLQKNPSVENGILTLFFLNLLKLDPGMAVYQPAGLLHAYLEGQNVELMANSDNVLRAGLTPKHIDVAELLRTCSIAPSRPEDFVIRQQLLASGETRYPTPFPEFELAQIAWDNIAKNNGAGDSGAEVTWEVDAPEILFCYRGSAKFLSGADEGLLYKGESLLLLPKQRVSLRLLSPGTQLFKARNLI